MVLHAVKAWGKQIFACGRLKASAASMLDMSDSLATAGADPSTTSDAASELNRVLQSGRCCLQFKTGQSFGDDGAPCVNVVGIGNCHPSAFFRTLRQEVGSHHVAVLERFLLCSGRAVEAHASLPAALPLPEGFQPYKWSPLLESMVAMLGISANCLQLEYAVKELEPAPATEQDGEETDCGEATYLPSKRGLILFLGDGAESRLRFKQCHKGSHSFKMPEFRVANRDIPIPPGSDLATLSARVIKRFEVPNQVLHMSKDAQDLFSGFQASFGVQQAVLRSTEDAAQGHHVQRAYDEIRLAHALVALWSAHAAPRNVDRPDCSDIAPLLSSAERLKAACEAAPVPSQFDPFMLTQREAEPLKGAEADDAPELPDHAAESESAPSGGVVMNPCDGHLQVTDPAEVPSLSKDRDAKILQLNDREEIMAKTLLRGEAVVFGSKVVDSMHKKTPCAAGSKQKFTRVSLKLGHWKAVMASGLAQYRVGRYDSGENATERKGHPRIHVELPDSSDPEVLREFHNRLMQLCCVPYTCLAQRVAAKAGKSSKAAAGSEEAVPEPAAAVAPQAKKRAACEQAPESSQQKLRKSAADPSRCPVVPFPVVPTPLVKILPRDIALRSVADILPRGQQALGAACAGAAVGTLAASRGSYRGTLRGGPSLQTCSQGVSAGDSFRGWIEGTKSDGGAKELQVLISKGRALPSSKSSKRSPSFKSPALRFRMAGERCNSRRSGEPPATCTVQRKVATRAAWARGRPAAEAKNSDLASSLTKALDLALHGGKA
eukprot:s847_g16.t1